MLLVGFRSKRYYSEITHSFNCDFGEANAILRCLLNLFVLVSKHCHGWFTDNDLILSQRHEFGMALLTAR